jgi:hypothetical protein
MGKFAGQTVYINWILAPDDMHMIRHRELDNMLSIAYNLRMAAKSYQDMAFMSWARTCENSLAIYRRYHYPHQLASGSVYA